MQPLARKFYDVVVSNPVGEIHMAPSLMKFYVGRSLYSAS